MPEENPCFHVPDQECWSEWNICERLCPNSTTRIRRFLYYVTAAAEHKDGLRGKPTPPMSAIEMPDFFSLAVHELISHVRETLHTPQEFAEDLSWASIGFCGKGVVLALEPLIKRLRMTTPKAFTYRYEDKDGMRIAWANVGQCEGLVRYLNASLEELDTEYEKVVAFKNNFADKTLEDKINWLTETTGGYAHIVAEAIRGGEGAMQLVRQREAQLDCIPDVEEEADGIDTSFDFGGNIDNPFEEEATDGGVQF